METGQTLQRLCRVQIQRLLVLVIGVAVVLIVLAQLTSLSYNSYMFVKLPVTKGILVREVAIYDNTSTANEGALNESRVEKWCKVYDCKNSGQMGPSAVKQNDAHQTGQTVAVKQMYSAQTGQTIAVKRNDYGPTGQTVYVKQNDSGQTGQTFVSALKPTRLTYMISVLEATRTVSFSKAKSLSVHDRLLQLAKVKIKNAPMLENTEGLHASLFLNISKFLRSYKLMETTLKVYIYKEGKKPVFHDPKLRGIYASEGWFMKLLEKNRKFIVKDPKKAHLFYLPFSSLKLRNTSQEQNPRTHKELEQHLKDYTSLIAGKYPFWNRTNGTDHFLVACHDWAMKLTRNHMGNCIRSLCNSNLAGGFKIGKDTTLPATYIRSAEDPVKDLGGNPPSERPILAFFAGGMHGNLRPILLQHWQDKEPDMKIFGPMARDIESKARYRTYMKSSKYCICARGYEVYTPRIVESIYYECVPVIISDNYVPPFFEVLDWGAFAVFVLEKDVANLGNILRSISDEKYLEMQERVKMVQQHFIWHKMPIQFDLFHMILHSIWNNRMLQVGA